jgi:hypothetical protein
LQVGDVILQIEDEVMFNASQVEQIVEECSVGQMLRLKVCRGEKEILVTVTIGDMAPFFQRTGENAENRQEINSDEICAGPFTNEPLAPFFANAGKRK